MSHRRAYRGGMTYSDNGILAKVPGQFIGMASQGLPSPETATDTRMSATIDADWAGRVRITYERRNHRHGKSSCWTWAAIYAEAADPS